MVPDNPPSVGAIELLVDIDPLSVGDVVESEMTVVRSARLDEIAPSVVDGTNWIDFEVNVFWTASATLPSTSADLIVKVEVTFVSEISKEKPEVKVELEVSGGSPARVEAGVCEHRTVGAEFWWRHQLSNSWGHGAWGCFVTGRVGRNKAYSSLEMFLEGRVLV